MVTVEPAIRPFGDRGRGQDSGRPCLQDLAKTSLDVGGRDRSRARPVREAVECPARTAMAQTRSGTPRGGAAERGEFAFDRCLRVCAQRQDDDVSVGRSLLLLRWPERRLGPHTFHYLDPRVWVPHKSQLIHSQFCPQIRVSFRGGTRPAASSVEDVRRGEDD